MGDGILSNAGHNRLKFVSIRVGTALESLPREGLARLRGTKKSLQHSPGVFWVLSFPISIGNRMNTSAIYSTSDI